MPLLPLVNSRATPEPGKRRPASVPSMMVFFREWLSSPRAIGAVVPSSRRLARCIASTAGCRDSEVIVELGGGTGAITRALLEGGISPRRLIVIERSPALVALLRARFPQVRVIQGDATRLSELLKDTGPIGTIVSGLPLRSLPPRTTATIVRQASDVLEPSGLFVQFTYWLLPRRKLSQRFLALSSRLVLGNLPPARVWAFVNRGRAGHVPGRCARISKLKQSDGYVKAQERGSVGQRSHPCGGQIRGGSGGRRVRTDRFGERKN